MRIWPWCTIKDLRFQVKALELEREGIKQSLIEAQTQVKVHRGLLDEKTRQHEASKVHLRQIAATMAARGFDKIVTALIFVLFVFNGFSQPILREWFTTNQTPITYAPAATIDGTTFPQQALMFATDGDRPTIGDGVTAGGALYGVRYWTYPSNNITGGSRPGELAVSFVSARATAGPTLWINAGRVGNGTNTYGTNWIAVIAVKANDLYTNEFGGSPYDPFILFEIGTNGNSDTGGTGGPRSFPNISTIRAGNGGGGTNNGTGGSGSDSGGFSISGGDGGWATGTGSTGGSGGGGGSFAMQGGNGGNASFGFTAGNGGLVGNFVTSGGIGGNDTASGAGANGGAGGIVTTKGGDAEVNSSGISVAGGKGGTMSLAGVGTNAGGSFTATGVFHKRPGGSVTTFASTYETATIATSTTTAGAVSTASETSLLGTPAFLAANSAQTQGWVISSNTVDHVGRTLRLSLWGYAVTNGAPSIEIKVKLGGTVVVDTGVQTMSSIVTTQGWRFQAEIPWRTVGGSGTVLGQGKLEYGPTATSQNTVWATQTATTTISTLVDETLDVTVTQSTGNGNVFLCTGATAELMN